MTSKITNKYPWGIYGGFTDGIPSVTPPWQDRYEWVVDRAARYITRDGFVLDLENGFHSDLASVPRLIRGLVGANKRETVGALFHDKLYRNPKLFARNMDHAKSRTLTRIERDRIFLHIMLLGGTHHAAGRHECLPTPHG